MRFIAATILLMAVSYVVAQNAPIILCGKQMANASVLFCYGPKNLNIRDPALSYALSNLAEDSQKKQERLWNGRQKSLAASWTRLKRQELADESWLKPCITGVIITTVKF